MGIGVVILNYKNWMDTVLCVESVLASNECPAWVIIVDNASPNDSVVQLQRWAAGGFDAQLKDWGANDISAKPLPLRIIGGQAPASQPCYVSLVCNKENRGYAAGNNAGIRLLMLWGADAVWILNNDTVVDKNALGAMRERFFSKLRPGLCGSRVHYADSGLVQCRGGGKSNPWTGLSVLDGYLFPATEALQDSEETVEKWLRKMTTAKGHDWSKINLTPQTARKHPRGEKSIPTRPQPSKTILQQPQIERQPGLKVCLRWKASPTSR